MSAYSDLALWCYKNPGAYSTQDIIGQFPRYSRGHLAKMLRDLAKAEPKLVAQVGESAWVIRPPEITPEPEPEPEPAAVALAEPDALDFIEILPDDDEIYPPFKIRIYDHFRGKRGEQWYRVRDEVGKRGIFRWIDDDD